MITVPPHGDLWIGNSPIILLVLLLIDSFLLCPMEGWTLLMQSLHEHFSLGPISITINIMDVLINAMDNSMPWIISFFL